MVRISGFPATFMALLAFWLILSGPAAAQGEAERPRTRITERLDMHRWVTLRGNIHPQATAAHDRGALAADFPLDHLLLQLQRAPEQEQALNALIDQQHDPASPNFHRWLTPEEFGNRFGASDSDIGTVTAWLRSQGFQVNGVSTSRLLIDFSGTAGQVQSAFHSEIHRLEVNGAAHIANMTDPRIPAALSPVVQGVVSLHDFPHRPLYRAQPPKGDRPQYSSGTHEWLVPADLATIYNLNPLFNGGIAGQGQTIAVVEDSDLYSTADVTTFQSTFGLTRYGGTMVTVHPSGQISCTDPGVTSAATEATLDVEWALAAAPAANIVLASCRASTIGGARIALINLVNGPNPPAIISVSYGLCETAMGAAGNAQFSSTLQQAAAQGISVFVAAGDSNAAACDQDTDAPPIDGVTVNGLASTPYAVSVGGTDFEDYYLGSINNYWSTGNTSTFGSALSYIPEIPWNDTCASSIVANYANYYTTYGSSGYCQYMYGKYYRALVRLTRIISVPRAVAVVPAAARPALRGPVRRWAGPAPVTPNRLGRPGSWEIPAMACAIFPMSRCSARSGSGAIPTPSAFPKSRPAAFPAPGRRAAGGMAAGPLSRRRSWPAFRP